MPLSVRSYTLVHRRLIIDKCDCMVLRGEHSLDSTSKDPFIFCRLSSTALVAQNPDRPADGGSAQKELAVAEVRRLVFRLRAAIRPSMPSAFKMAANSERRVATSLIAPSR